MEERLTAEWNHMRHDQFTVGLVVVLIQQRGELFHAKGRQDGEEIDFVREVEVQDLVRWEGRFHAIKCDCEVLVRGSPLGHQEVRSAHR